MVVQEISSSNIDASTVVGDDYGRIWCIWYLLYAIMVSLGIVVLATTVSSSAPPFRLSFLPKSKSSSPYYSLPIHAPADVVDLHNISVNIISAATKHDHHSLNSTSESYSHQIKLPSSSNIIRSEEQKLEKGLARARAAIRKAASSWSRSRRNFSKTGFYAHVYRNPAAFFQSYIEMEKRLKVYTYEEGEVPMVHYGPCKNIYASEGRFIHEMEQGGNRFRTRDPHSALVYFMPFSVTWMVKYLYMPNSYNLTPLKDFASDYVRVISTKYPFWNRTQGADHFMLSCHDWGPHASKGNPFLYNTSMRVLCNANSSEGFNPRKDVSLPEVQLYDGDVSPKLRTPPPANNSRSYLAFFAGGVHGPIRPILLQHWKGRDPDLPVYEYLPRGGLDYYEFMLRSKFCLCPSGYEVASPRIVEAIYAECVPVILSEHYVLPFSDVLKWEAFSIKVEISQIPKLKEVLMSVSEQEYMKLKEGLRAVRRHFELNQPAKRFDMFHMILHSVWLRRINFKVGLQTV